MKKSIKAQAALAFAVSLWIANGGVASASVYIDVNANDTVTSTGSGSGSFEPGIGTSNVKELTASGDWGWAELRGGMGNVAGAISGYKMIVAPAAKLDGVYGGWNTGTGNATGNTVIIGKGATIGGEGVSGGTVNAGSANATGNTVELQGATSNGNVMGGRSGQVGNINLVTGNTLILSGENTVNGFYGVQNFETINIEGAVWGTPVLTVNTISNEDGSLPDINTEGIVFSGIDLVNAGGETPLITGGMAGYAGHEDKITGSTYKVGSTLQGKGHTVLEGANLKYVADTSAGSIVAREQTHNTVMGAEVGMAALSVGNEFIGAATEGLSLAANTGADGVSSFAQMGGGSIRQETGSHVDIHTWNAILGLGHQNKKERGTMEYGAFFEYGTGNYTTHAENDLRGDGSARYTGGGLLAKYTTRNNVYVEGSLRAGSVHDDARNVMSDAFGNPYSYDTNAPYLGFHLGVGKEIALSDGNSVDVYGKYFFNRKNGVSFDAGGHYDLDAVTSSVIRLGARYTVKRDKWNFYGGLAYEHELDGKATGTADGVAIRGADTSGGSFRGELGATVKPGENSPWNIDLNVSGFAGKKQGFTGGVSVAFMF